jgi:exopolysaccharide production protein ExoZ
MAHHRRKVASQQTIGDKPPAMNSAADLPATRPAGTPRIAIIQAARAFAALAVLLHHAGHSANKYGGPMPLAGLTNLGAVGVDIFFVLSGFIILHATVGTGLSCRHYAWARFRRIFLPYWPVGLAMAAVTYGFVPGAGFTLRGWVASITLLPVGPTALNVAWTLKHELIFYGFVAVGWFSGWWRTGLALWTAAIIGLWASGHVAPVGLQPIDAEFLMGIAAWAAWRSGNRRIMLAMSAGLAALGLLVAAAGIALGLDRSGLIATAALFAALLPWLVMAEQTGKIRTPRALSFLGDASYAIYLVHALPLLALIGPLSGFGWQVTFPVITLAGLIAGVAYHLLVERPLLRLTAPRPRG